MADSLSVSFQYTREDFLNVVVETLGFDVKKCWSMLLTILFLIGLGIYLATIHVYMATVICVFIAIMFVPVYILIAYLNLSSVMKDITDCVYTLEKHQLIAGSNFGFQYFDYKDINRIVMTKPILFIYVSKKNAYFIPIRAFNSEDKANNFITELKYGIEVAKKEESEINDL